jgi:hypothetical protein
MLAFLLALIAVIGIGYGASIGLEGYQRTSDRTYIGAGAKPDPDPRWADLKAPVKK